RAPPTTPKLKSSCPSIPRAADSMAVYAAHSSTASTVEHRAHSHHVIHPTHAAHAAAMIVTAAAAAFFLGASTTMQSVVSSRMATSLAFCSAVRSTLVGVRMPALNM